MSRAHRSRSHRSPPGSPAQRPRATQWSLTRSDGYALRDLRMRIKRGSGERTYAYRESPRALSVTLANHEIQGRDGQLVGVYDRHVTAAMLRQDLYGEEPADSKHAE